MSRATKKTRPKEVPHLAQQSPLDLGKSRPVAVQLPPDHLVIRWKALKDGVYDHNGGHPQIVFTPDPKVGVSLHLPGQPLPMFFPLKSFHFHAPSEHRVDDQDWPLELHVVHETTVADPFYPGQERPIQAVLAVFFAYDKGTPAVNRFFRDLTLRLANVPDDERKSTRITIPTPTNPRTLMPGDLDTFYRYEGSLTTDTYNENSETVNWVVFRAPKPLDRATLDAYIATLAHEHKEPQLLHRRFVLLNTRNPESPGMGETA